MYSEKAKQLRRCKAKKQDGTPCRAWAMWGDPRQFSYHRTIAVCTCEAYSFPHRPGGGLCRWPEPPLWRSTIPAGTRGDLHGLWKKYKTMNETSRKVIYVSKLAISKWGIDKKNRTR